MPTDAEQLAAASARLSINLPPRREAAGMARRAISHALSQWGLGHITDTAALLVSELIANSVRHARTPTAPLELTAAADGNRLRIEVSDADPRTPTMRSPSGLNEGGFGLVLVHALTGDWGVRQTANGKRSGYRSPPRLGARARPYRPQGHSKRNLHPDGYTQ